MSMRQFKVMIRPFQCQYYIKCIIFVAFQTSLNRKLLSWYLPLYQCNRPYLITSKFQFTFIKCSYGIFGSTWVGTNFSFKLSGKKSLFIPAPTVPPYFITNGTKRLYEDSLIMHHDSWCIMGHSWSMMAYTSGQPIIITFIVLTFFVMKLNQRFQMTSELHSRTLFQKQ